MLNRLVTRLPRQAPRRLFFACLLILTLAISLPLLSLPTLAQTPIDQLQQQRRDIDKQRATVNQQRDRVQKQENSAQTKLGGINKRIKATAQQIATNEQKLKAASQSLSKLQRDLAIAENDFQKQRFSTVARLKYLQRQQGVRGWAILLQSQSLNEFLDRRYQLQRVYTADRKSLKDLQAQSQQLEKRRRVVANKKNEIALLTQELHGQKAEFQAEADAQKANITRLKQDRTALEAAEEQLAKDSENIASLIQSRLAEQSRTQAAVVLPSTGLMGYPCNGPITSSFGERVHPILGYVRFHGGIDFGDDYGSPIFAANPGVVIFSGWYSGYGDAVIIDHGGGVTTLYGHSSELYVSEGETVQRGQAIAAIGSSGFSTGPHLHFEVRVNGEPVDPIGYF
jgi:murein DD-endopeptidase MepM/ murein hydrolase activator NlpD